MRWYRSDRRATGHTRTEVAMTWFALLAAVIGWCAHAHDARARNDALQSSSAECVRVFSAFFVSLDGLLSQPTTNIPAVRSLINGLSMDLRCDFQEIVAMAMKSPNYRKNNISPIYGPGGKETLPRSYAISLAKDRARVVIFFTSDGEFMPRRSGAFLSPYSENPLASMDPKACLSAFLELQSYIDKRMSEDTRDWHRIMNELRSRLPLTNCSAPQVHNIVRASLYLHRADTVPSNKDPKVKDSTFSYYNDRIEIYIRSSETESGELRVFSAHAAPRDH